MAVIYDCHAVAYGLYDRHLVRDNDDSDAALLVDLF